VSRLADAESVMLDALNANRRARGESDTMTRETLYDLGCITRFAERGKALDYLRQHGLPDSICKPPETMPTSPRSEEIENRGLLTRVPKDEPA